MRFREFYTDLQTGEKAIILGSPIGCIVKRDKQTRFPHTIITIANYNHPDELPIKVLLPAHISAGGFSIDGTVAILAAGSVYQDEQGHKLIHVEYFITNLDQVGISDEKIQEIKDAQ